MTRGRPGARRQTGLPTGAVCAPLVAHGMSLAVSVEPRAWLTLAAPVRWSLAADGVLFTTACAIVCAPVVGAAVAARHRANTGTARSLAIPLVAAVLLFAGVSAVLTLGWRLGQPDALGFVMRSHVTLTAVSAALVALGALCAALFRNPLDAAGASLLVSLGASGGLLVGGASVADLPRLVIAAGLTASPLVAMASAAQIDIVRSDLLYQISPLAHMQIDYPTWSLATACYLAVVCVCVLSLTATDRRMASAFHR